MPVDTLSDYIYYIFRRKRYRLDEGTPINGIYLQINPSANPMYNLMSPVFKFKVEIYTKEGKTYLEISKVHQGLAISYNKMIYGENYSNSELNRIVDNIKYLKPSVIGYFICNKCGGYFELQEGESPDDYDTNCKCGGTLKYIASIGQPNRESVEKIKTNNPKYLNISIILISIFSLLLFSIYLLGQTSPVILVILGPLFALLAGLIIMRLNFPKPIT